MLSLKRLINHTWNHFIHFVSAFDISHNVFVFLLLFILNNIVFFFFSNECMFWEAFSLLCSSIGLFAIFFVFLKYIFNWFENISYSIVASFVFINLQNIFFSNEYLFWEAFSLLCSSIGLFAIFLYSWSINFTDLKIFRIPLSPLFHL